MINKKGKYLCFTVIEPKNLAIFIGNSANGRKIAIPNMLNNKCARARAMGIGLAVAKEARIAVIVVPIFAPNVYG
jgi:hypothetical protein